MLAPAKINLALHVTGQRADGYHVLDSLVVFADYGDELSLIPQGFEVEGPFGAALADTALEDNLVLRAAHLFGAATGTAPKATTGPVGFRLTKKLPVASGIGGGSADCAAALTLMNGWFNKPLDAAALARLGLQLGADVPVCLRAKPTHMQGVGEVLGDVPPLPPMACVLVNPAVAVSTPAVFKALPQKDNPPMNMPTGWDSYAGFVDWLARQRNDLEAPAMQQAPAIAEVLAALNGVDLARMSGSGATVFGLCEDLAKAQDVADAIKHAQSDWWVQAAAIQR